jgi:hypothetical protein
MQRTFLGQEGGADGRLLVLLKVIGDEAQDDRGFADGGLGMGRDQSVSHNVVYVGCAPRQGGRAEREVRTSREGKQGSGG